MTRGRQSTEYAVTLITLTVNSLLIAFFHVLDAGVLGALNAVPLAYVAGRAAMKTMKGES